jgi:dihydroflavonol-4-reductase
MRALVTGGTGFVGSHLVRALLDAGHEVRVLHRTTSKLDALQGLQNQYETAIGDVTDLAALQPACAGCDWVFHVAAVADYWRSDRQRMMHVNVEGTRYVLQAARAANVKRVVFTSSAAAIGLPQNSDAPADESIPFNLPPEQFPYGYSKVQAEAVVAEAIAGGLDVVIVNPTVVIGPGDLNLISGSFVIETKLRTWLTPITGGGIAVIDVRDVAAMHIAAAEQGRTGERYILNSANYSYRAWFDLIADVLDVPRPLVRVPNAALPAIASVVDRLRKAGVSVPIDANQVRLGGQQVHFDGSKAQRELIAPQVSMRQSVSDTYQWYQEHGYIRQTPVSRFTTGLGNLFRK